MSSGVSSHFMFFPENMFPSFDLIVVLSDIIFNNWSLFLFYFQSLHSQYLHLVSL